MLGNIEVGCIGMGCMGFSHAHGDPAPREECIKMIRKAHELGVTLFDTADVYANGHNEILVGEALKPIRDEVVILTKFNPEKDPVNDLSKTLGKSDAFMPIPLSSISRTTHFLSSAADIFIYDSAFVLSLYFMLLFTIVISFEF